MTKQLDKIQSYSVKIDVNHKLYEVKLKVADREAPVEIIFPTIAEVAACVDLLRNEINTFYNQATDEIIIAWEPTGENDPKYGK